MRTVWNALAALVAPLLLTGCPVPIPAGYESDSRENIGDGIPTALKTGLSTREDVLMALGEPDASVQQERWFVYGSAYRLGGGALVMAAGSGMGAVSSCVERYRRLAFQFDQNGVLQKPIYENKVCTLFGVAMGGNGGGYSSETKPCLDFAGSDLPYPNTPVQAWTSNAPIDARIGIAYAHNVRRGAITHYPNVNVDVGATSVERFNESFAEMFTHTEQLPDWPPWREVKTDVDGVMEVDGGNVELGNGVDAGKHYAIRATFRSCFYDRNGMQIKCWTASSRQAYQSAGLELLGQPKLVGELANRAIRDVVLQLSREAGKDPDLKAWAVRLQHGSHIP